MTIEETVTFSQITADLATIGDDWRRTAVVYQIYPRSFADSNGDGIGDLPGITGRLCALADLGIDAIWLSPFYSSPQADAGYDVADYRDVDPVFGTLADFDAMLERAHGLGLKVIVDLVPNHSSDEHAWFQEALAAAPGSPERARYVFRQGRGEHGELPPNNWESCFRGPAWTRTTNPDGTAGQWYLHLFDTKQPDWNWENPEVRAEFLDVLRFWLDRGVDGFRVDVAHSLIKAPGLPDRTESEDDAGDAVDTGDIADGYFHTGPMWDQDRVHEVYRAWRALLDTYSPDRILCAEAWVPSLSRLARYVRADEMHQAFNFDYLESEWDADHLRSVVDKSVAANDEVGAPTTWVLSNHDVVRHVSRLGLPAGRRPNGIRAQDLQPDYELGLRRARAASLLMLALPGSAYLYQGEELGLPDHTALDDDLRQDPTWWRSGHTEAGRDGCRVPLPWEAGEPGLGFGPGGATWLPQPASYAELARDRQEDVEGSTLELYRTALAFRRAFALAVGDLAWVEAEPGVLRFTNGELTVAANTGTEAVPMPDGELLMASVDLSGDGLLPPDTTVWLLTEVFSE